MFVIKKTQILIETEFEVPLPDDIVDRFLELSREGLEVLFGKMHILDPRVSSINADFRIYVRKE